MEAAQRDERARRLGDPLRADLATFAGVDFELDLRQAAEQPGEPIAVTWVDGPTVAEVATRLGPYWVLDLDPGPEHYPIQCSRVLSKAVWASLAAMALELEPGMEPGDLQHRVLERAEAMSLLHGPGPDLEARGHLLAELLGGAEPQQWARWLCSPSGSEALAVASGVLDGALQAAPGPLSR